MCRWGDFKKKTPPEKVKGIRLRQKKSYNVPKFVRELMKSLWGDVPNFLRNHKMSTTGPSSHRKAINLQHKEELIRNFVTN
jgi:hypothetical protein